ncbi:hypothetical protein QE369_002042 [Agrobacterium larrymoorei]|uniref:Uncharacterized protein n=1 Tax=Agrobacterium larrymoorei TaxID=160699 RepID=A0AAJ2ER59_9HYPH|nr:hypothetical protein [Agrobacterium larrymoorei]MDR6101845.1 hypothetical protein [Agrobacterium larrymoorei]
MSFRSQTVSFGFYRFDFTPLSISELRNYVAEDPSDFSTTTLVPICDVPLEHMLAECGGKEWVMPIGNDAACRLFPGGRVTMWYFADDSWKSSFVAEAAAKVTVATPRALAELEEKLGNELDKALMNARLSTLQSAVCEEEDENRASIETL